MGDPRIDSLHDPFEDQLSAARYMAERDAAVQELQAMREHDRALWMECHAAQECLACEEEKARRLGCLVWRLQNRLARAHRRERNLRKGMREWREKAIGGPVRTVSAYDLLPEEDMQTLRWVRKQGGLDALKAYTDCFSNLLRECHGYRDLARDYEKRIMPEGYEWPRYEDGRPVRFGDAGLDVHGKRRMVGGVKFTQGGFAFISDDRGRTWWADDRGPLEEPEIDPDKRVKRPAPAVLAADGEPLEVGQTVYHTDTGREYQIHSINDDGKGAFVYNNSLGQDASGLHLCSVGNLTHQRPVLDADGVEIREGETVWSTVGEFDGKRTVKSVHVDDYKLPYALFEDGRDPWSCMCCYLTHRAPVIAADGRPLREGEHVYHVETGAELVVKGLPKPGEYQAVVVFALPTSHASHLTSFDPDQLTHAKPEPPDSRQAVVNEIGDEMAARIDLLVSSGRWSDAD